MQSSSMYTEYISSQRVNYEIEKLHNTAGCPNVLKCYWSLRAEIYSCIGLSHRSVCAVIDACVGAVQAKIHRGAVINITSGNAERKRRNS